MATIDALAVRGISYGYSNEYSSLVADAREITLNGSRRNSILETRPFEGKVNYKKLIWIDSDISWTPEDFIKLYENDKDIVSGAYLLGNGEVTAYAERLGAPFSYQQVLEMKDLVKVHSVGFGFLAVKQGVFETLTRPWFQSVEITMVDPDTKEEYTFPIMGEDVSWCERVNRNGFDVWLDPTVRVTHHKTMKLTWEGIKP